tara:strand:+ start:452 stop:1294 length:843 start_codon:yes stop_codon:yes gene_type:complete
MRDFRNDTTSLALNTATLGHNLPGYGVGWEPEKIIDACADRGFGAITFWTQEITGRAHALGKYTRSSGLEVCGLCRTPYLTGSEAGSDYDVRKSIELAAEIGAEALTIVTGGTNPQSKGLIDTHIYLIERLQYISQIAKEYEVKLALEPMNPMFGGNRTCLMTVADANNICEKVNSENLGLAIDIYHVWWDTTLEYTLQNMSTKIFGYHLNDWLENTTDMLLDRGMMGDGVADLKSIRRSVENTGYNGYCEVEIFSANKWWRENPGIVLDTIVQRYRNYC